MERQGYDVKYASNLDLHENPGLLQHARAFISSGHDEYYSKTMWDNLVEARDAGINLAFFSANQIYWQVRFADGMYGRAKTNRVMYGYRGGGDPVRDNHRTTGKFRDLGRPEATLIGNQYSVDPVMGDITITNPGHWLFAGSGANAQMKLKGLLGYEVNSLSVPPASRCWRCAIAAVTPYEWYSPPNTFVLAHSTFEGKPSDMTWYVAPSAAQVFSTGSIQWSWGLDDFVSNGVRPDYTDAVAQRMTANVFDAIGEKKLLELTNVDSDDALQIVQRRTRVKTVTSRSMAQPRANQWRMVNDADGRHIQLVSRALGTCMSAGIRHEETGVTLAACNGSDSQKWRVSDVDGELAISDKLAGRCLRNGSGKWRLDKEVQLSRCDGSSAARWRMTAS